MRKALAHAFVHELCVEERDRVRPTFAFTASYPRTRTPPVPKGPAAMVFG
jgi:hypothetical protein